MNTKWLNETGMTEVDIVGGKNASLGEMITNLSDLGLNIPNGFVVTSYGYDNFMNHNKLNNYIKDKLKEIDYNDIINLKRVSLDIRTNILNGEFPNDMKEEINEMYFKLSQMYYDTGGNEQKYTDVAIRSSGTSEDMPDASFAGQQDTYLNIEGEKDLLDACKRCMSSLFTDRAISYRSDKGFNHFKVKLSITVQKMVRSDKATSGVMFSIDTESGFKNSVLINSIYGLGEYIVQGIVNPMNTMFLSLLLKILNQLLVKV